MIDLNTRPIIKRIVVKAEVEFATPALIGSGEDDNSDRDVIRAAGVLLLPGTSLAGVLRSRLGDAYPGREANLFGTMQHGGEMSSLWVYDTPLAGEVIILDGVALDYESKTAIDKKKYDYEAVSAGAEGTLRLMLVIRAGDDATAQEESLQMLLFELEQGNLSVGGKVNRGFGRLSCKSIKLREFSFQMRELENLAAWEAFDWGDQEGWIDYQGVKGLGTTAVLTATLGLDGSIMIRTTRALKDEEDYRHLSMGDRAVIYGTSWAGAFRGGLYNLLRPRFASREETEAYLENHFGFVHEDDSEHPTQPSKIQFDTSVLEPETSEDGYRILTRTSIDRFSGGAANGALFTEQPWVGGRTVLKIRYPKESEETKQLILLALDGMDKKLLTVGGETSVGRGMFSVRSAEIDGAPVDIGREGESDD